MQQFPKCKHTVIRPMGKCYTFPPGTVMTPIRRKLQGRQVCNCLTCDTSLTPKIEPYVFQRLQTPPQQ